MEKGSLKVQWSTALETGHRATDNQHKVLIDIINELATAIEEGDASSKLREILNLLQHYTEWHFEREELCMDRCKCPIGPKNKEAHRLFISNLEKFQEEYRTGGSVDLAERMYKEMVNWLVHHIQGIDVTLRDFAHEDNILPL